MDPFEPIAGLSLEQYAEICAEIADAPHDPDRAAQALAPRGITRADWETARSGWIARLQDLSLGGAVAARYLPAYHGALEQRRGPAPLMSFEDYAAICGEAMASGLTVTLLRIGLVTTRWSQISFHWNTIIAREPARFLPFMAMVEQEAARLNAGGAPRPAPKLMPPAAATPMSAAATPMSAASTPMPAASTPMPLPGPAAQGSSIDAPGVASIVSNAERIVSNPEPSAPAHGVIASISSGDASMPSPAIPTPSPAQVQAQGQAPAPAQAAPAQIPAAPTPSHVAPIQPNVAPIQPSVAPIQPNVAPIQPNVAPMTPAAQAYASPPPGMLQPPTLQPQAHPPQPQAHPAQPQAHPPQPQAHPAQPQGQQQGQQGGQTFEKQAGQAVQAVGSALVSGFKEIGSAFDSLTKSSPKVGSRVLVAWSDGNRYPGTVAQVGQGHFLVTMGDGSQHWIPEAYVKTA